MDSQEILSNIQISDLIFKYLNHSISDEERIALDAWRGTSASNEALFRELTDPEVIQREASIRGSFNPDQAWVRMKKMLVDPVASRVPFNYRIFFKIAAAIIVLLSAGAIIWHLLPLKNQADASPVISQTTIIPGGNRATLTLADGRVVPLDSMKDGDLSSVTDAVISKSDGLLSYGQNEQAGAEIYHTITTPRGGQYKLQLADGSKVWLNAASSIRYPVQFSDSIRLVEITGEAYFEVNKSSGKPFRVKIKDGSSVEVLGTSFNINAYADEQTISATLLEGSIMVNSTTGDRVRLKPGQQALLGDKIRVKENINPDEIIAWKDGSFYFNRADIRTIMRQVSRWYDVEIVYEGVPKAKTFSGMVSRMNDVSQVLLIMERAGVRFRIEGRKIFVLD